VSSVRSRICTWLGQALLAFPITDNYCSLFVISTENCLISSISCYSEFKDNEKLAAKHKICAKSRRVVHKAESVNPKVVCNPHVELVVLWDFICFIVRFKRSQIM